MKPQKINDRLIDRFVTHINTHPRERLSEFDVPPSVLKGEPDAHGYDDWAIRPYQTIDWIEPLERRLPFRLPHLYRSLVTRYIFPSFCVNLSDSCELQLLANTPEGDADHEMRKSMFWPELLARGFLYFANPAYSSTSDPVCFDMNRKTGRNDHPIVQFDHEEILCNNEVRVESELAHSFEDLILGIIGKE